MNKKNNTVENIVVSPDHINSSIENKVIKYVAVEKETGICELSAADNILSML